MVVGRREEAFGMTAERHRPNENIPSDRLAALFQDDDLWKFPDFSVGRLA